MKQILNYIIKIILNIDLISNLLKYFITAYQDEFNINKQLMSDKNKIIIIIEYNLSIIKIK